ncbi:hypothetical protein Pdca_21360 [Pseudonocardia autotrophica]|nr:hypothetical protein Pdca_21360 [Pseudonocardia autotrophica]
MGSRELSASLVLLYGNGDAGLRCVRLARVGTWRAADQADLLRWGYPDPRGSLYFVTDLTPVPDVPNWLDSLDIRWLLPKAHRPGAPIAVTWWDVLRSGSSSAGR